MGTSNRFQSWGRARVALGFVGSMALSLCLGLSVGGCVIDSAHDTRTCSVDRDCPGGQRCDRGFCIGTIGTDAGMMDAARSDAGPCPNVGRPCTVFGMTGACRAGLWSCTALGEERCLRAVEPSAEECDDEDNDCDGTIDEQSDVECYGAGAGCSETDGVWTCAGICSTGIRRCVSGGLTTCEGAVGAAASDGCTEMGVEPVDDDCDGVVDQMCTCTTGEMQACYGGPAGTAGVGACVRGVQTCGADSLWGACVGEMRPTPETCAASSAGVDNDCNGTVDDVPGLGGVCMPPMTIGACADGTSVCQAGMLACVGPMPMTETCDGIDNDCNGGTDEPFSLSTDPLNCGVCGHACGVGQSCCSGMCVNLQTDSASCGMCGNTCGGIAPACCRGICQASDHPSCLTCAPTCGAGSTCCAGACANTSSDRLNCGGCGRACGGGQFCCAGTCVDESPSACGSCSPCGAGQLCCGGTCQMPGPGHCGSCGRTCAGSETCCGGTQCVNTMFSASNCGMCGRMCPSGDVCAAGGCCASADVCGGRCVNRQTDSSNCGSCGRTCGLLRHCEGGDCVL